MEFTWTSVYTSTNKCIYVEGKYLFRTLSGRNTDSNIIKSSCHSRRFFVLQLLFKRVTVVAIARKTIEHIFILIQFCSYLRKKRVILTLIRKNQMKISAEKCNGIPMFRHVQDKYLKLFLHYSLIQELL